jgi:hypothetical protein
MKRAPLLTVLVAFIALCVSPGQHARADGQRESEGGNVPAVGVAVLALGAVFATADLAFTVGDITGAGATRTSAYGLAELGVAAPQAVVVAAAWASTSGSEGGNWLFPALSAWTGLLAVHGIYTAVRGGPWTPGERDSRDTRPGGGPRKQPPARAPGAPLPGSILVRAPWIVAPTVLATQETLVPGAALLGRF